ncbi:MAG: PilZ domain-containing protein [Candidatus Aureabacteria bacterium]|nr:PilZ domain-containing protein [Candidatus Auribacterota bacterium]
MNKSLLSPEEIKEKRKFERFELYLPLYFKIYNDDGIPLIQERIEGFSRNYSREGMLIEVAIFDKGLQKRNLFNAITKGEVHLPIVDAPVPFEGEIKWIKSFENSKYYLGLFISYIDDFHRIKLLHFSRRTNRRPRVVLSLVFTLVFIITLTLMSILSVNAYIATLTKRHQEITNELNARISFLNKKLQEIASIARKRQ